VYQKKLKGAPQLGGVDYGNVSLLENIVKSYLLGEKVKSEGNIAKSVGGRGIVPDGRRSRHNAGRRDAEERRQHSVNAHSSPLTCRPQKITDMEAWCRSRRWRIERKGGGAEGRGFHDVSGEGLRTLVRKYQHNLG